MFKAACMFSLRSFFQSPMSHNSGSMREDALGGPGGMATAKYLAWRTNEFQSFREIITAKNETGFVFAASTDRQHSCMHVRYGICMEYPIVSHCRTVLMTTLVSKRQLMCIWH